jgi:small subunit ribosomal protein S15
MTLEKEDIEKIVKKFGKSEKDTGSPETQIAIITERLNYLTEHFKLHKRDNHSRRGLLKLVERRKKLLEYLKKRDLVKFKKIKEELKIR